MVTVPPIETVVLSTITMVSSEENRSWLMVFIYSVSGVPMSEVDVGVSRERMLGNAELMVVVPDCTVEL